MWMNVALSNRPKRADISLSSPENENISVSGKFLNKAQEPSDSGCYVTSSEFFTFKGPIYQPYQLNSNCTRWSSANSIIY
jgi:hypothetical protein